MVGIYDRLLADLVDGLLCVGDAPGPHIAGEPVLNGHQIVTASSHRQACDGGVPDLVVPVDKQPT